MFPGTRLAHPLSHRHMRATADALGPPIGQGRHAEGDLVPHGVSTTLVRLAVHCRMLECALDGPRDAPIPARTPATLPVPAVERPVTVLTIERKWRALHRLAYFLVARDTQRDRRGRFGGEIAPVYFAASEEP